MKKVYTNDELLMKTLEYMNENIYDDKWDIILDKHNHKCARREMKETNTFLLKAMFIIEDLNHNELFEAITDSDKRNSWDSLFNGFKILEEFKDLNEEIIYVQAKPPISILSERDFVQSRKIYRNQPNESSHIVTLKSIDSDKYPEKKYFIRAFTHISAYYTETISSNPLRSKLVIISNNDIKGYVPKFLIKATAQKATKTWVNNLIKGCYKLKNKN